jgi:hypothetical protein
MTSKLSNSTTTFFSTLTDAAHFLYNEITGSQSINDFSLVTQMLNPDVIIDCHSNSTFIKDIQIILLSDVHTIASVIKCNRFVYDLLKKPGSPLYVEAENHPECVQTSVEYQLGAMEPSEDHRGWDLDVMRPFINCSKRLKKHMRNLLQTFKEQNKTGNPDKQLLLQALQSFLQKINNDAAIHQWLQSNPTAMTLLNQLRTISTTDPSDLTEQVIEGINQLNHENNSEFNREVSGESFQLRQASMIASLHSALTKMQTAKQKAPIFVVAGVSHFVDTKSDDFKMEPILENFLKTFSINYMLLHPQRIIDKTTITFTQDDIHSLNDEIVGLLE